MQNRRHHSKDSGFALLLIFLMAAVIAISLYVEIPRIAFETQRQKEQLLVARGEQYKRAIQLFMKANNRWPSKIEELESLNNKRYLRKRFLDPMTGKDEWRVIHINGGVLTDSHTTKKKEGDGKGASTAGQYVGEQVGLVGQAQIANGAANGMAVAMRKRDSDGRTPGIGDPGSTGATGNPVPGQPTDPATGQPYPVPGQPGGVPNLPPGMVAGFNGQPGMTGGITPQLPPGMTQPPGGMIQGRFGGPQGLQGIPGQPGMTGTNANQGGSYVGSSGPYVGGGSYIGSQPNAPGAVPGQNQYPGNPVNSQAGGVSPAYGTAPGSNGMPPGSFQQPGMQMVQGQGNAAAQMIQQILTQPRPGGMPAANPGMGAAMGGGIAGFASTADSQSIMVYNDQSNYGDWEFVFDPTKVKPLFNPNSGAIGQSAASMGSMPGGPPGTPVQQMGGQPTPAGMNGGFGAGQPMGGFGPGQPMGGFGQQPAPPRR